MQRSAEGFPGRWKGVWGLFLPAFATFPALAVASVLAVCLISCDPAGTSATHEGPVIASGLKDTTLSVSDTAFYSLSATDPDGIQEYRWDFNGDGVVDQTTTAHTVAHAVPATAQVMKTIVTVVDNSGRNTKDTSIVTVLLDPPLALFASPESVAPDSAYTLKTSGSTGGSFGRIAKFEWSIGSPDAFHPASGSDTVLKAPATATDSFPIALRVTDDDGNTATAFRILKIHVPTGWDWAGTPGFSAGPAKFISLAMDGAAPYVAYQDGAHGSKATVMRFDGTKWINVGAAGFSAGEADYTSLAIDGATPYVAYQDGAHGSKATVMRFDGTSWVTVGSPGFSAGLVDYTSLAIAAGAPYVAFKDDTAGSKATVMRFEGSAWADVGTPGFSAGAADYVCLAMGGSVPYVAFQDGAIGAKATVMRFNGTAWVYVGAPGFSAGAAYYLSLAIDSAGSPYLAYLDAGFGSRATVMRFDGTQWVNVGAPGFSSATVFSPSLAIDGSTPYLAYGDYGNSHRATVMRFDGAAWACVGTAGFSTGQADYTSLAVKAGIPFLAYQDGSKGIKATVAFRNAK